MKYFTLGFLAVSLLTACDPPPPVAPEVDLEFEVTDPTLDLDPSRPDDPADVSFALSVSFLGETSPTSLRSTAVELVGPEGTVSEGLSLSFLEGSTLVETLELDSTGRGVFAGLTGLTNAAASALCGGMVHATVTVHASHCDCETTFEFDVVPTCLLDNRASALLAMPLLAAADRPCSSTTITAGVDLVATSRYGWDAEGRLVIEDDYIDDTHSTRRVYTYDDAGWLEDAVTIDAAASIVFLRTHYEYEGGLLTRVTRDGAFDEATRDPDGLPEAITTYTSAPGRWDILTQLLSTGRSATGTLTYDFEARTFSGGETDGGSSVSTYSATVSDPNVFVAVGVFERLFRLQIQSITQGSSTQEFVWTGGRLTSDSVSSVAESLTTTYAYDCAP